MPKVYSTNSLPFWETSLIIAYTLKNMTGRWYLQKKIKLSIGEKNTEVDVCVIPNPIISFGSKKASLIIKK